MNAQFILAFEDRNQRFRIATQTTNLLVAKRKAGKILGFKKGSSWIDSHDCYERQLWNGNYARLFFLTQEEIYDRERFLEANGGGRIEDEYEIR